MIKTQEVPPLRITVTSLDGQWAKTRHTEIRVKEEESHAGFCLRPAQDHRVTLPFLFCGTGSALTEKIYDWSAIFSVLDGALAFKILYFKKRILTLWGCSGSPYKKFGYLAGAPWKEAELRRLARERKIQPPSISAQPKLFAFPSQCYMLKGVMQNIITLSSHLIISPASREIPNEIPKRNVQLSSFTIIF